MSRCDLGMKSFLTQEECCCYPQETGRFMGLLVCNSLDNGSWRGRQ